MVGPNTRRFPWSGTSSARESSLLEAIRNANRKRRVLPGWLKAPFGARSSVVVALVAVLAIVAGSVVVLQITNQMRREADDRLAASSASVSGGVDKIMVDASSDIRLARQNVVFE